MALTTCPDCQTEISTLAVTCPKCGMPTGAPPVAPRSKSKSILRIIVWSLCGVSILAGLAEPFAFVATVFFGVCGLALTVDRIV